MQVAELPLFPLPLVLFPGADLPLHLFEPRYRALLRDCLADDNRFGIVYRPDGLEEHELPRGHAGCMAEIQTSETLPDGRANVLVTGGARFVLQELRGDVRPYWLARVELLEDEADDLAALHISARRVRALFAEVTGAAREIQDSAVPLPDLPDDPRKVAFAVAALIDFENVMRQQLLGERSARARLALVEKLLTPAREDLLSRARAHEGAKSNGKGPH